MDIVEFLQGDQITYTELEKYIQFHLISKIKTLVRFFKAFSMAAIYSLFIINKSGGLIFYKDYGSAGRMDTNDSLRLASLWHSMHAISQQLSPIVGCAGIEALEADTFDLHCFQSLTGIPMSTLLNNLTEKYLWRSCFGL
ncbi:hypothetical protein MRB53_018436 [Persea americana]|uniref:Uncharacterized protein n=1 Tax=Persea americana TaxID=3435 RepID=A0ACC2M7F0_PERAE|nr:hypothetical protein MRB53_018436 [Persea americana]